VGADGDETGGERCRAERDGFDRAIHSGFLPLNMCDGGSALFGWDYPHRW
jgi:hypothetical protein